MSRRVAVALVASLLTVSAVALWAFWDDLVEKRVRVVIPGMLVRGAWQRPGPLRRIIEREKIKTIVTLTAINRDDPKYLAQAQVVRQTGVDWIIVPMRGSRATPDQMADAADLLADADRQPVFFHCVAGHHRTGLVHAAYRIRHEGWSAEAAWQEMARFPWARPGAPPDREDRQLIEAFAARQPLKSTDRSRKDQDDARSQGAEVVRAVGRSSLASGRGIRGLEPGN